jgi:hypothetical protein
MKVRYNRNKGRKTKLLTGLLAIAAVPIMATMCELDVDRIIMIANTEFKAAWVQYFEVRAAFLEG